MMEPNDLNCEPYVTDVKTFITASPDRSRYKEFAKRGACKLYMPVWTLEELLTVGADVYAHTAILFNIYLGSGIKYTFNLPVFFV